MAGTLANVRWEMGQALLPEHFEAQEQALLANITLRFRMQGLPAYGIGSLKWNDTLLSEGIFSIQAMTLIMPSGVLLDVPGNAKVSPFNLNVPGSVNVPIYLHLSERAGEGGMGDEDLGGEEETIARNVYQLVLSSDQSHPHVVETIKIAEFAKNPEGVWYLAKNYVPPLLHLGKSPFLMNSVTDLADALELFHYKLSQEITDSYLSGESLFGAKQCLKSLFALQRLLANLKSQVHLHPYIVYEALKDFYAEVCFYGNTLPEHITKPYDHDQLAVCFREVLKPLQEQISMVKTSTPYQPFECVEGVHRISLPKEVRQAKEVYLLIQKDHVNKQIPLEDLKLASLSRVALIHKLALTGISFNKIDRPPFQHPFGPEVDFFLIIEGEEWDYALKESTVAFYDNPRLEGVRSYLYWRSG